MTDNVNRVDAENCAACEDASEAHGGQCLFHEGVDVGWEQARRHVVQALEDPESVTFPRAAAKVSG